MDEPRDCGQRAGCTAEPVQAVRMPMSAAVPEHLRGGPFSSSTALRFGLTARQLQGLSWRRVFQDVYAWEGLDQGPRLRVPAASLVLPADGAISGRSAAFLYGVDVLRSQRHPVEVTVPRANTLTCRPGIFVRRALLADSDVRMVGGARVTTPLRTAFDLARLEDPVEAVVCLDALLHADLVREDELRSYIEVHPRWRGVRRAGAALDHADGAAESPMESRLRMILVNGRLPRPLVNQPVYDETGRFLARPDLRIERVIIEYDGRIHLDHAVFVKDLARQNLLIEAGYILLRYTGGVIYQQPTLIVAQVRSALDC